MLVASYGVQQVHAVKHAFSPTWFKQSDAIVPHPDKLIKVYFALKQRNLQHLESLFWNVTNPNHSQYAQYLNVHDITNLVSAHQDSVQYVHNFIDTLNKDHAQLHYKINDNQDMITIKMTVAQAEVLFGTKLAYFSHIHQYANIPQSFKAIRASQPLTKLPADFHQHVDFIGGINSPIHRLSRQQVDTATATKALNEVGATSPAITSISAGDAQAFAYFNIFCNNGAVNTDVSPVAPCTSNPPAVSYIQALVSQDNYGKQAVNWIPEMINCTSSGTSVGCFAVVTNLKNTIRSILQLKTFFVNGNSSSFSAASSNFFPQPYVTPDFLAELYNIPAGITTRNANNIQSVAEFLDQFYSPDDLTRFFYAMGVNNGPVAKLIGPNNVSLPGTEAQLDIQYLMGVARNASTWFWSVPGRNEETHREDEEPFLTWLLDVGQYSDTYPLVHSVSYDDTEETLPQAYTDRLNIEFQKLGLRGISLLFAAGDDGIASVEGRNDATRCLVSHPVFPGGSPFVTSIGGTQLTYESSPICSQKSRGASTTCSVAREKVCSADTAGRITTGGGFSNYYSRPSYQDAAVTKYLADPTLPVLPANFFSKNGRAYPDVSGIAVNYLVLMGQEWFPVAGTSASTPLVAAMVTLWNDILISQGKPPLGFLNPWLYNLAANYPEAFSDVVVGNNRCLTSMNTTCCEHGFSASIGWDATTGLGTPRFDVISQILAGTYPRSYSSTSNVTNDTKTPVVSWVSLGVAVFAVLAVTYVMWRLRQAPSGATGDYRAMF